MYFRQSTPVVLLLLCLVVGGAVAGGIVVGRRLKGDIEREPVGVVQGTLLGLVGLLLAFGLSMAVGRYEFRRTLVVEEANALGTTYLRAQLLAEPQRTESLDLLLRYSDATLIVADSVPDSGKFDAAAADIADLQGALWAAAGEAVASDPSGSAPRLYIESLNETIDSHASRVASLRNRVPTSVMMVQVVGSAVAIGVLALYLTMLGRSIVSSLLAAAVIILILFVSFDLDRPQRGFITVPFGPLEDVRAAMDQPPAATGP